MRACHNPGISPVERGRNRGGGGVVRSWNVLGSHHSVALNLPLPNQEEYTMKGGTWGGACLVFQGCFQGVQDTKPIHGRDLQPTHNSSNAVRGTLPEAKQFSLQKQQVAFVASCCAHVRYQWACVVAGKLPSMPQMETEHHETDCTTKPHCHISETTSNFSTQTLLEATRCPRDANSLRRGHITDTQGQQGSSPSYPSTICQLLQSTLNECKH